MIEALLAFGVMLLIVGGMSVGVMAGRKPITGSCGGLAGLGIDAECEICGGNPARCETASGGSAGSNLDSASDSASGSVSELTYEARRDGSTTGPLSKREL